MVRNSVAILDQSGAEPKVDYYWDLTDNITGDFFRPPSLDDPHWYWPGTGVAFDGKAYLFLSKMKKGDGPAGFAFQTAGCSLWRVDNPLASPRSWKMTRTELGYGHDHFNINSAALVKDEHVYLMGYHDGPSQKGADRAAFLSRIAKVALNGEEPGKAIEFWSTGGRWLAEPTELQDLFKPGPTETAVHHDPATGRYMALTISPFKDQVLLVTADELTGPWSDPQPVYTIPEMAANPTYHAYTTRFHPVLSPKPGHAIFTYVVNTSDFWGMFSAMDIYYPRFVEMTMSAPEGGK